MTLLLVLLIALACSGALYCGAGYTHAVNAGNQAQAVLWMLGYLLLLAGGSCLMIVLILGQHNAG